MWLLNLELKEVRGNPMHLPAHIPRALTPPSLLPHSPRPLQQCGSVYKVPVIHQSTWMEMGRGEVGGRREP